MSNSLLLRQVPLLFLLCCGVAGCGTQEGERPLRWGADSEGGAPYIFKDPERPDQNIGFEVDLVAALSRELKRPIEFTQYRYESLIPGLKRGDIDFAMNGLEITPDRRRAVRFSRPYYIYQQQLVVRADESRFRTLEELKAIDGLVVGTLEETAAERIVNELGLEQRKRIYDGQLEPYQDLELGRIDAVLLDLPIAAYYAKRNPKLRFEGEPKGDGLYAIAFRKDDQELASQFDQALGRVMESGELKHIYEKWNLWNEHQEGIPKLQGDLADETGSSETEDPEDVVARSNRLLTFKKYFPLLCKSAWITVVLSFQSMALAIAIGLVVAIARMYGPLPIRWLAVGYVEFFRGIPVLLLLYFLYYGLPEIAAEFSLPFQLRLSPMQAGILGFGLNYAAYEAEIYRSGISAIPQGQWEAAASLGMSGTLTFRRIILPQSLRTIIPPMTNDFVALFKDTSVVSVIAVTELTKQYQMLAKSSLKYGEIGLATAALYLIMSVPLGYLSRYLETKWARG